MKLSQYERTIFSLLLSALLVPAKDTTAVVKHCPSDPPPALQHDTQHRCPLPIDETTGPHPIDWSPWTHRPDCTGVKGATGSKLCLYTNSRQGHHGISLLTKPKTAAESAGMLNEEFPDGHDINNTAPSYAIVDIPHKGKGVLATRKISRAEPFMADWATILLDLSFTDAIEQQNGLQYFNYAATQLSDPDEVLGLARSSKDGINIVEDVMITNAFSYTLGGDAHMALYPEVARVNHACRPNAFVKFSATSFDVKVVASRDIEVGEEITISYISLNYPRNKRQQELQRWGFQCQCSLCAASEAEVAASDHRRERIALLQKDIMRALVDLNGKAAVRAAYDVLALVEAENIPTMVASQCEVLARLLWKAGDIETATKYAQKSLDTLIDLGYIDYRADGLAQLLSGFTA